MNQHEQTIRMQPSLRKGKEELALHLWPRYPNEWSNISIGEVLFWPRGMRQGTVTKLLKNSGLLFQCPMDCVSARERKWLADELLKVEKRSRAKTE